MKTHITPLDVAVDNEHSSQLTAEASELGWPPGHFPTFLTTALGNAQPFVLNRVTQGEAIYFQSAGTLKLTVFND